MSASRALLMFMRLGALLQVVVGIGLWTGHLYALVDVHRTVGVLFVLALWIEPSRCLAIGNDWSNGCAIALGLVGAWRILLWLALSSAPALIAAASSVVAIVVALAGVAIRILIPVALLRSAAQWLRVVVPLLLLLLLLIPASAVARSIRGSGGR